ncbi:hypothetical protein CKO31_11385 [Thiohalocapsa halophila]|uniref:Nucleotidyltransferase family protein n=1 Tax=Thiohalocapsa halophila TaxID=69359 RepID=A0ABS1CHI9_9GAMM|nr:nucleotidyltransferase [Thiohalocapsa halophila]MBK1631330.1 hypothetical protein [Thiohalocapsa halophila]
MDFLQVLRQVGQRLEAARVRFALIGGFAMALRGVQRATVDLDFLLMLDDLERADEILRSAGYSRDFHSENVSHYIGEPPDLGRIDILHAFRGPSLSMLRRADQIPVADGLTLPVARVEDIVGLKVQAAVNDPQRAAADWADIKLLVEARAALGRALDWELIKDYLHIFGLDAELPRIEGWYGKTDRD